MPSRPPAPLAAGCRMTIVGTGYTGGQSSSAAGHRCRPWREAFGALHRFRNADFPDGSRAAARNRCRNPLGESSDGPWCFVYGSGERERCEVPLCRESPQCRRLHAHTYTRTHTCIYARPPQQCWWNSGDTLRDATIIVVQQIMVGLGGQFSRGHLAGTI